MSDLDDKEDFQIHRNAWVKEHGTKRGFNTHNYKRYGFANESALRRHIGRRESIRPNIRGTGGNGNKRHRAIQKSSKGSTDDSSRLQLIHYPQDLDHTTIPIETIIEWGKEHCDFATWEPVPEFIKRFLKEVWMRNKTMTIYPRDHGKTIWLCVLFLYWILELNRSILVIAGLPYKIWRIIFTTLEQPRIQNKYDYEIVKSNENRGILYTSRQICEDPIFNVSGWGGKYTGLHPQWTHLEDIIQLMPVAEATSERLFENFNTNVRDLSQRLSISGTRKDLNDFYARLKKKYFLELREVALELDGRYPEWKDVIFEDYTDPYGVVQQVPVSLSDEYMASIKYKILGCPHWTIEKLLFRYLDDRPSFMSQFQNNPLPRGGKYFDIKYWITWPDYPMSDIFGKCYIAVDPSFGKKDGADYFAILVAIITHHHLDIVKVELHKGMSFRVATEMLRFYSKVYNPLVMLIETNFWQALLYEDVEDVIPNMKPIVHSIEKTKRIDSLDSPYRRGMIRHCEGMGFMEEAKEMYILYDRLPSTPTKKDDYLDAEEMLWEETKWYLMGQKELIMKTWDE